MNNGIRFEQPAHEDAAEQARQMPGAWVLAHVYRGRPTAEGIARNIVAGRGPVAYRPAADYEAYAASHDDGTAVWVRYVAGLTGVLPMRETLTVRVPDYGTQRGYEGVTIRSVEIAGTCRRCGGPRGPVRPHHFMKDGTRRTCDRWDNPCGHLDEYSAVLAEARTRTEMAGRKHAPRGPVVEGIKGGLYEAAVDFLAGEITRRPWLRAKSAADLLRERGEDAAAAVVDAFITSYTTGTQASAKAAALYLISRDRNLPAAGQWSDGRIGYERDAVETAGGAL